MIRNSISRGALALCLLAPPLLAIADHHMDADGHMDSDGHMNSDRSMDMDHHDGGDSAHHQGGRHYDPVQRAEKHLKGLEKKLKLKSEQQSAWNTYSGAVMERAQERAGRMEAFHGKRGEMRDMDTASKLEKMAQWMRERADRLDGMASDTRAFQQTLTAEQQTIFDMYWEKHAGRGKGRNR